MRAEFHGVLSPAGLDDAARDAFEALHASAAPAGARSSTWSCAWAAVGVHALRGGARPLVREAEGLVLVVAGDPSPAWDVARLAELRDALAAGRAPALLREPPPAAACLVDVAARRAWLLADRAGLVPVHVARADGALWFSTRLRPLLRCGAVPDDLDPEGVADLLAFEHLTGDRTLHRAVRVLPPATTLALDADGERATVREEPPVDAPDDGRPSDRLHAALLGAVSDAVAGAGTVGITLSGGLDSRALLGCALEVGAHVETFTFGLPGSRDIELAEELARRTGVAHSTVPLDGSHLPRDLEHVVDVTGGGVGAVHGQILAVLDRVAAGSDVLLDGLGGDMLSGGHLAWDLVTARDPDRVVERTWRRHASAFADDAARARLLDPDLAVVLPDPRDAVRACVRRDEPPWRGAHRFDVLERQRRFVQHGPHLCRHAVDVRTPFRDADVEAAFGALPLRQLVEQRAYLDLHRRAWPELARVPDAARGVPLAWPQGLRFLKRAGDASARRLARALDRPARGRPGTTDYPTWLRTTCRALVEERLLDGGDVLEGVLRRAEVERVVAEHMGGRTDHTTRLGALLALATWLQLLRATPRGRARGAIGVGGPGGLAADRDIGGRPPARGAGVATRDLAARRARAAADAAVGLVVVGRNEGPRLERCLRSLPAGLPAVYVDSGSTDDSLAIAASLDVPIHALDPARPFSAARARNEGFGVLRAAHPTLRCVQFVDADCELEPGWVDAGRLHLDEHPEVGVLCGRLREREPSRSVYHRLADMEWDEPVGDVRTCGGNALVRTDVFEAAGGYQESLVAGEEPDLCLRVRRAGHLVRRLDLPMTTHEADITRFAQWWRRAERWGHGYTEMLVDHGRRAERRWVRAAASCVAWAFVLPVVALACAAPTDGWSLLLLAAYAVPLSRAYRSRRPRRTRADAALYAGACLLGKWAELHGVLICLGNRLSSRRRTELFE